MVKACNIQWDIDFDEAFEKLDSMTPENAAKALNMPVNEYMTLSKEDRHDTAYDLWHRVPAELEKFMGLPDEVEIPEELLKETDKSVRDEDIANWLSDEYGFCHEGFELSTDKQETAAAPVI